MAKSPAKTAGKTVKPAATPEQEVMVGVLRAADLLTQCVERTLKPAGLTPTQFNVLRILRGASRAAEAGHPETAGATADGGLMCSQIAERMITRDPDVTRLITRLMDAGLVERRSCSEDKRRVLIRIAPRGMAELAKLDGPLEKMHDTLISGMDKSSLKQLGELLGDLVAGLAKNDSE